MRIQRLLPLALFLLASLAAASEPLSVERIRALTEESYAPALELYRDFLSLPNDANHPEDIARLVDWMEEAFAERGFETQRLATAGSPLLLAQRLRRDAERTVLIYLQADGQPVDPSAWLQESPYRPVLKSQNAAGEWEIIGWESLQSGIDSWTLKVSRQKNGLRG